MNGIACKINNLFNFNSKKRKFLWCFCVTMIMGILGYAFSFFNPSTTLDAFMFDYSTDVNHLYSIGRFAQPWFNHLVSMYRVEFLSGIIWLCLISACVYFTDCLFELNSKIFILALSSCILFSGLSVRCMNLFPFANALFVLSVLLGVLAVYSLKKSGGGCYLSFLTR